MEIHPSIEGLPEEPIQPVVTLGNFDGIHRGHQAILARIKEEARRLDAPTMVITFHPHPRQVLRPDHELQPLMTLKERLRVLWELDIDHALVIPFDHDFAEVTAQEFVDDVLWQRLRVRALYVGQDTAFGHGRSGDVGFLASEGRRRGFATGVVDPIYFEGRPISSSRVRGALMDGHLEQVTSMLGRHHMVVGAVVKGEARGREMGFPTANLFTENGALPTPGVYAVQAILPSGERHPAVLNIGTRPTFEQAGGITVEAHLLDFEGDLYGEELRLSVISRIRGEQTFSGPEQLVAQIQRDVAVARERLQSRS